MTSPIVAFVLLGTNPAPTFLHSARVAKAQLPNVDVVLITDRPENHRTFPGELIEYQSNRATNPLDVIRRHFPERKQLAGGYWIYTLERVFALSRLEAIGSNSPVIHVESDVLLCMTPEHLGVLATHCLRTAVPRYSSDMGIASLLYAPSINQLHSDLDLLGKILLENTLQSRKFLTDMQLLGLALNSETLQELPTLPEHAWCLGEAVDNRKLVFDGLAYGQYLFGRDPVHNKGIRRSGHQNEFFPHQLSTFDWKVQKSTDGYHNVGFCWDKLHFELANIHLHSKEIVELPHSSSARWNQVVAEANGLCEREETGPYPDQIHSQRISFMNQIRLSRRHGKIRKILDIIRKIKFRKKTNP